MNDASRAVLALTNRLVGVGVPPLRASELWRVLDAVDDPGSLLGASAASVASTLGDGFDAARLAALLDPGVALAVRLDVLDERGIWTVTPFDHGYPPGLRARLGVAAPPVLYGAGFAGLLAEPGIGIVGARAADPAAGSVARAAAGVAAGAGESVVSGGSPGVDAAAMAGALDAGGAVVNVMAEPLERVTSSAETRRQLLTRRLCAVTPYDPAAGYSVRNAKGRNKIIFGLSRLTLVVASGAGHDTTIDGATEAHDHGYGPVVVWRGDGEDAGNAALEAAGIAPLGDLSDLLPRASFER